MRASLPGPRSQLATDNKALMTAINYPESSGLFALRYGSNRGIIASRGLARVIRARSELQRVSQPELTARVARHNASHKMGEDLLTSVESCTEQDPNIRSILAIPIWQESTFFPLNWLRVPNKGKYHMNNCIKCMKGLSEMNSAEEDIMNIKKI